MRLFAAILTDVVLITYVFTGCVLGRIYFGAPPEMLTTFLLSILPVIAINIFSIAALEGYDFSKMRNEADLAFSAALGVIVGTLGSFALHTGAIVYYAPDTQPIGRSVFIVACLLNLVLLTWWRRWYTKQRRKRGDLRTKVLVVGSDTRAGEIAQELKDYSQSGHEIAGYVREDEGQAPEGDDALGHLGELPTLIREHGIDEILVTGDYLSGHSERIMEIVDICGRSGVLINILPGLYEAMVGKLDLYEVGGIPLIELRKNPLSGTYAFVKRAMDLVLASVGLIVGTPILLAAAIAIKLDSPGPVFYRQIRTGRGGKEFKITKLRSMRVDAEKDTGPVWASEDDPRVTRVGRFLRKRRLDELPQLWDVLVGHMSLVGPRPERPHFVEEFTKELPLFPLRLRVRPGITALSHVWGRYDSSPAHRLRYDLVYMGSISFLLDARILVDTVKTILTTRGAQ